MALFRGEAPASRSLDPSGDYNSPQRRHNRHQIRSHTRHQNIPKPYLSGPPDRRHNQYSCHPPQGYYRASRLSQTAGSAGVGVIVRRRNQVPSPSCGGGQSGRAGIGGMYGGNGPIMAKGIPGPPAGSGAKGISTSPSMSTARYSRTQATSGVAFGRATTMLPVSGPIFRSPER